MLGWGVALPTDVHADVAVVSNAVVRHVRAGWIGRIPLSKAVAVAKLNTSVCGVMCQLIRRLLDGCPAIIGFGGHPALHIEFSTRGTIALSIYRVTIGCGVPSLPMRMVHH